MFIHLSSQLEEQGWSLANEVSTNTASSSIWSKSVDAPDVPGLDTESWQTSLTVFLNILDQGDDSTLVQFELWSD